MFDTIDSPPSILPSFSYPEKPVRSRITAFRQYLFIKSNIITYNDKCTFSSFIYVSFKSCSCQVKLIWSFYVKLSFYSLYGKKINSHFSSHLKGIILLLTKVLLPYILTLIYRFILCSYFSQTCRLGIY